MLTAPTKLKTAHEFSPELFKRLPDGLINLQALQERGELDCALAALGEAETIIREQAKKISELENLALTDELTGLLNRRGFLKALDREIALLRRDRQSTATLMMVDLDGFKAVNDQWGHAVGDNYLRGVAHVLSHSVRSTDLVARLGGDEFAILFPSMNEENGYRRLQPLEKSFNGQMMMLGNNALPLHASFGLTVFTGTDMADKILASADLKLYAHKSRHKLAI